MAKAGPQQRAYGRAHYERNKPYYVEKAAQRTEVMRQVVRDAKNRPCADCQREYPSYVMDFDHRDGAEKLALVSRLVTGGNLAVLLAEIEKCDVVCSNCHRERTHQRLPK